MGKRVSYSIQWDKAALQNFIAILNYIKAESPTNAKRVNTRIVNTIKMLPKNPQMFKSDEWKLNNDGSFRVFVKDSIRVSYKIDRQILIIARVSHTSQEPIIY